MVNYVQLRTRSSNNFPCGEASLAQVYVAELKFDERILEHYSGHAASEEDIQESWRHVYHLHFLKRAEETAHKCQRGFVLRQHSPEVSLFPESCYVANC